MRITLPPPSRGAVGTLTVLNGDDYGLATICYVGAFAFISEDITEDAERYLRPEMREALQYVLDQDQRRIAIFCSSKILDRVRPIGEFISGLSRDARRSMFSTVSCLGIIALFFLLRWYCEVSH
jgi:hypothetical protein